jgi:glutamate carboxypeptidase
MDLQGLQQYFEKQKNDFIKLMEQMIGLQSHSGDRQSINRFVDFLENLFGKLGLKGIRTLTPVGDIIRFDYQPDFSEFLVLLAHMDTVKTGNEPPSARVKGSLLYGNGAYDMKNGIALFYSVIRACRALGITPGTNLTLLFNPDEENGSPYSGPILEKICRNARAVLLPEPSCPDGGVKTRRKGVVSVKARLRGKPSHSGIEPEKGLDANRGLASLIVLIDSILADHPGVTFNPGIITGGNQTNMISGFSELKGEIRSFSNDEIKRVSNKLENIRNIQGLAIHLETEVVHPPLEPTPASTRLYSLARTISKALGNELHECGSGGSSDGSSLSELGIPVLDGLGMIGGGAHSDQEYIDVSDFAFRATLLTALCQEISHG